MPKIHRNKKEDVLSLEVVQWATTCQRLHWDLIAQRFLPKDDHLSKVWNNTQKHIDLYLINPFR